ncbi:hypothetical protein FRC03_006057 [Tulasnella sp. 419]|nr:hypothetical protein FRC03_006057 [Tulasnella sp. 419]
MPTASIDQNIPSPRDEEAIMGADSAVVNEEWRLMTQLISPASLTMFQLALGVNGPPEVAVWGEIAKILSVISFISCLLSCWMTKWTPNRARGDQAEQRALPDLGGVWLFRIKDMIRAISILSLALCAVALIATRNKDTAIPCNISIIIAEDHIFTFILFH